MSITNIYILRLEGGRYYIGKSDNIAKRFQQHLSGYGSSWTKKYKPVALEESINNVSPFQEDSITKQYMSKYGIDKVRGGSYCEVELSEFQTETLKTEIWGAKDLCKQCGRSGHWVKDCYANNDVSGNKIDYEESYEEAWGCDHCDRTFTTEYGCRVHERSCKTTKKNVVVNSSKKSGACYRCGRQGHYSPDCIARTHCKGYTLDSDCESDEDSD